jgi:hypothetical protein
MRGTLLIYLLQFFSGIIILAIILMSSTIISYHIFQKNWINSKLQAEVLSSIISSLSSSSLSYNVSIRVGSDCSISVSEGNITTKIGNDKYSIKIIAPEYIQLKESKSSCEKGFLYIYKKGDEIWLE